jgi:alpha-L-fucosidase 2
MLPALPNEWDQGRFDGVCVRGGFELDYQWEDRAISEIEVVSKAGKTFRINAGGRFRVTENGKRISVKTNDDGTIEFNTSPNSLYKLIRR